MISSAKLQAQLIVDGCKRIGVKKVVLSPGSRNAPLSIAFDEDDTFEVFVITDERSAAFVALGLAQVNKEPVVIACTSGSAPLNYYPAIAEAFYQEVPLIVLSADRPIEWMDQGDGQTIRQENVFNKMVLKSISLLEPLTEEQRWYAERMLSETLQSAIGKQKGPIHINVPFSEPLYQTTTEIQRINQWILQAETHSTLSKSAIEDLKNYWNQSKKRLIIVGQLHPDNQLLSIIENLALDGSVAILVEHTSNAVSPYFISTIDRTLSCIPAEEVQQYMPDLIVSIGGAIVSKRIKTFLRKSNVDVIRFGESFPFMDTFQNLRFTAEINPSSGLKIIEDFIHANPKVSNFGFLWNKANYKAMEIHNAQLPTIGWSDLYAMASIFDIIPENAHLHLANSSAVRYALLFDPIRSLKYWCNRGTSGIDGSSSTALGASLATLNELHVLVTGDLSFFYDSNALWNKYMHSNFRIIVINNGGGDIFNYIPGPSTTKQWKKVFVAEQKMQVKHIANQFGLDYYYANNKETLYNELESFFVNKSKKSKIIEIDTMDVDNSNVLNTYFSNFLTN